MGRQRPKPCHGTRTREATTPHTKMDAGYTQKDVEDRDIAPENKNKSGPNSTRTNDPGPAGTGLEGFRNYQRNNGSANVVEGYTPVVIEEPGDETHRAVVTQHIHTERKIETIRTAGAKTDACYTQVKQWRRCCKRTTDSEPNRDSQTRHRSRKEKRSERNRKTRKQTWTSRSRHGGVSKIQQ